MLGYSERGTLHLALLGPPQVYQNGQVLVFPSRKALALLLYLAVEPGKHSRKTLSELFWPESDAAHARSALRTTLVELRDVLAEGTSPLKRLALGHIPHLLIDHDTLGLDQTSGVSLDLHTLQTAWMLARDSTRTVAPLSEEARRKQSAQLEAATRLSRGGFLDGFSLHNAPGFDDWTRSHHEYWYLRMQLVFDRLSQWYEEAGEKEQAIATIIRWLSLSLLNEDASQRLMRLHFATGNRIAALQAYETLRVLLASEVHAEPTPETMALAEHIRVTAPLHSGSQPSWGPSSPLALFTTPLVGRTREYGMLLECYYAARSGQMQVVLLEGEAGIGKTRLAVEFVDWAVAQGTDVLRGQAFESSKRLSYQPFIEALRPRIERENAPDDLLHDVWLVELARLLPELRERYPDLSNQVIDASVARNHLFEAVARLLETLATHAPLVLFLDDLHWADTATLDLLHYLARRLSERALPIVLLLSVRTQALQTTSRLIEWRANLGRTVPLTRLQLGPLSAQDTLHLLQVLVGGEKTQLRISDSHEPLADYLERMSQRLFTETGGQPFYLTETLKLLLERNHVPLSPGGTGARTGDVAAALIKELGEARLFPPSVRELISVQLDRLSPAAFAFLVASGVLEHDATFERLCVVADLSEKEGLAALDEVLQSRLLSESKSRRSRIGPPVYTFAHDMIRKVVSVEAGEMRSRIFHRRALHALLDTSLSQARLAYHALAAGEMEAAFHWSVAAGDEARAIFALHDAIEHYEQAWQLLTEQARGQSIQAKIVASDVQHLCIALGEAYELARVWEQVRPRCGAMFEQALRVAQQEDNSIGVEKTHWYQAMIDMYTAEWSVSIPYGERALALARTLKQPDLLVQSLTALIYAKMQCGAWEENEQLVAEAHALSITMKDRAMEAEYLCLLANTHMHHGHPHMGIMQARLALTISQDTQNAWGQVNAIYELTSGLLDSGAYTEALEIALQAVASARILTARSSRANTLLLRALISLGGVYRAMQSGYAARSVDLEALTLNEAIRSPSYTSVVMSVLCADSVLVGEWANAQRYAQQAARVVGDHGLVYVEIPHWCVTEALLRVGDVARAQEHLAQLNAHNGDGQRDRVQYLWASAELAQWEGRWDQARSHLVEARSLAEEIGLAEERWQIQGALGDLDQSQGELVLAGQAYTQAVNVVQELAEKIEDETLRSSFLAALRVRHVLEHGAYGAGFASNN